MVFASILSAFTEFSPFDAAILVWWWNRSFQLKWTPSHFTVLSGVIVLVVPSWSKMVREGQQSYLRCLE